MERERCHNMLRSVFKCVVLMLYIEHTQQLAYILDNVCRLNGHLKPKL